MKTLRIFLCLLTLSLPITLGAQVFENVLYAYPSISTKTASMLPSGCKLWKDPTPAAMDKDWYCISRQRDIYLRELGKKDYEAAAVYSVWSSSEGFVWMNAAESMLHGKKSWQFKAATLDKALVHLDQCVRCCNKAIEVNIGTRSAKRCLHQEKGLRRYIRMCRKDSGL